MDSTVGREDKRRDIVWLWCSFSWVWEARWDFSFSFEEEEEEGLLRLVVREVEEVDDLDNSVVGTGVGGFELEPGGDRSESLEDEDEESCVMWIVIWRCMWLERAAVVRARSSSSKQAMLARERTIQWRWVFWTQPCLDTRFWRRGTMNEAPLAQAIRTTVS
jgi:hypothetical protein